ncbi:MAG: four helix bundle protein [Deltaproteobacteria bacterium]|nr:four helix bundle protein [Deltaproteobacteria bacterium]
MPRRRCDSSQQSAVRITGLKLVRTFQDLLVWNKAMDLVTEIYRLTKTFPKDELFGLTGQLRRAAISVPANIAEGQGRLSEKEFRQFLGNARGSLSEMETHILIAHNLRYLDEESTRHLLDASAEVGRILNGLLSKVVSAKKEKSRE